MSQSSALKKQPETIRFTEGERRVFRIPERISTADWAEKYRIVVDGGRKSPWRNDLSPCAVGVMDALDAPFVREVYVQAAPQTIKTQAFINYLLRRIDQAPGPAMIVMPDEKLTRRIFRRRLLTTIKATPRTAELLSPTMGDVTRTSIAFINGMDITGAWAGSAASMSSDAMEIVVCDEVNKEGYGEAHGDEPNAFDAVRQRTNSFPFTYKVYACSTPTGEMGLITQLIKERADVVYHYHVKCPVCGDEQRMLWENITWGDIKDPRKVQREKLARYNCRSCAFQWDDDMRDHARRATMKNGWRPAEDAEPVARPRAVAFIMPSWYIKSMSEAVANYLHGQKDPDKNKTWRTQDCAEAYIETVSKPKKEDEILKAKCDLPAQTVPEAALALTFCADVQKSGFWFTTWAWGRDVKGLTGWLIHYGAVATWREIESILYESEYPIADGSGSMRIWRAAFDTGGGKKYEDMSMTEETYWWIIENFFRGVQLWGTKGSSRAIPGMIKKGEALMKTPSGKKLPDWFHLALIDTEKIKDMFHFGIEQAINGNGANALYLHKDTEVTYARHILAEEKRMDKKRKVARWERVRQDNHLLDASCGAYALAMPHWIGGGVNLIAPRSANRPDAQRPAKKIIKQNKISRW